MNGGAGMKLKEVLQGKGGETLTVDPDSAVGDAIRLMSEQRVGSVLVVNAEQAPVGIFTERDVLNLLAKRGPDISQLVVRDVMTTDLVVAEPETLVDQTLALITRRRCRHIPVIEDGRVAGIVSIGDLVKAKLQETEFEVESLREYISIHY
jgi:CBS domain-containing protein